MKGLFIVWLIIVLILFCGCSFKKYDSFKTPDKASFDRAQLFYSIMFGSGVVLFGLFLIGII